MTAPKKATGVPDAAQLKAQGNDAFKEFKLDQAIELYSAAMAGAPTEPVYCANRSAALFEAGRYAECIVDIEAALARDLPAGLASRLAIRAARAALWQNDFGSAEAWLAHRSLGAVEPPADLLAQVKACINAEKASVDSALCSVAAGVDPDAPQLLRDRMCLERSELFASGHDDVRSMLEGAPFEQTRCFWRPSDAPQHIITWLVGIAAPYIYAGPLRYTAA
jgi:tetratricopeptide (TPR) repeat protein